MFRSWGRVMYRNCWRRPAPSSDAASYIEVGICLDAGLVEQGVEGDELPGDDEDDDVDDQVGVPQPVLTEQP